MKFISWVRFVFLFGLVFISVFVGNAGMDEKLDAEWTFQKVIEDFNNTLVVPQDCIDVGFQREAWQFQDSQRPTWRFPDRSQVALQLYSSVLQHQESIVQPLNEKMTKGLDNLVSCMKCMLLVANFTEEELRQ